MDSDPKHCRGGEPYVLINDGAIDPKQSRPIGLTNRDASAIEWVTKRARSDILNITHRLPDKLSGLVRVTTTTGALGTQSDIVLFSLVRNNSERIVGAAGTLQDLNVAISRSKEKLIILGNFEMIVNGWSGHNPYFNYWRKSNSRVLARLIDSLTY